MANRKSPKVRIVAGRVRIINKGFTTTLKMDSTMATTIAVQKLSMLTPGKM